MTLHLKSKKHSIYFDNFSNKPFHVKIVPQEIGYLSSDKQKDKAVETILVW